MEAKKKPRKVWYKNISKLVVTPIVAVIAVGFIAAWLWLIPHGQRIDGNSYQVVYISTGQAYFGKLQNTGGDYLVIQDPYVIQDVKQADSKKKATTETTLVKVEDQVYGPDNSMALRADSVLFWQNLRTDSKVTQAIKSKEQ